MVAAKSIPQNHHETPAQREMRILAEQQAKHISDAIDEQLRVERAELKKNKPDVKILLLGQSESGKSTTLKQFQLLHTPAAFQAERMAWRIVIYLNLVRSVRRVLDTISAEREEEISELSDTASLLSDGQTAVSSVSTDPETRRIAAEKYAEYSTALAPVLELEARLIRNLREDDDEDEATRLGDGSAPGWSVPRGEYAVRTTSNWKRALTLGRSRSKRKSASVSVPWWEDPSDPVHTLESCRNSMNRLWKDEWVRRRLVEKRVRLQESSGFYLDEIERITAKMYAPTDEDVLKARLKTVGVVEHSFTINMGSIRGNSNWVIYDVGGSRSQRHAWAPFFQDVNAIIFLAPISAFDQVLTEVRARPSRLYLSATALIPNCLVSQDSRVNRLEDSLLLWRAVVSNKLLEKVPIVLFLNKCDLLREKIEAGVQLKNHLLTYGDRPNEYEPVSKYLRNKFGLLHNQNSSNRDRELFIHFTAVIDKAKTAQIITSVREAILRINLKTLKLM
ncbi:guanine nucleotide binding protein, alpha subunit [Multifurca ochricompacta]|uniref:Guanine nucleotide binding protein, alpha subunit n=1 Tax=Multifurca ochricompacta TaxID=376703 RepID=A0AAD4LZW4_9AGAM|nr:guanine nucleotide binding protein, alpha subunit [Multifurca ochricompacta]